MLISKTRCCFCDVPLALQTNAITISCASCLGSPRKDDGDNEINLRPMQSLCGSQPFLWLLEFLVFFAVYTTFLLTIHTTTHYCLCRAHMSAAEIFLGSQQSLLFEWSLSEGAKMANGLSVHVNGIYRTTWWRIITVSWKLKCSMLTWFTSYYCLVYITLVLKFSWRTSSPLKIHGWTNNFLTKYYSQILSDWPLP